MSKHEVVAPVVSAVESLSTSREPGQVWVRAFETCVDRKLHQFVLFLKPEATAVSQGVMPRGLVEALLDTLETHRVEIGAVRVVSGPYLAASRIMESHYGVINVVSRLGEKGLTVAARSMLDKQCGKELASGYELVGGHQFLANYPQFTPFALSILFDNMGSIRLAPGTYARPLTVEGRRWILLNGFHPYQLERFTRERAVMVLFEGSTVTGWSQLRNQLAGSTDPNKAAHRSFRRVLLERSEEFGLKEVSQNANGIHLSAGPLEGMVEVRRFFSDVKGQAIPIGATCFGSALLESGLTIDDIEYVSGNPDLTVGDKKISAFDLTEECDSSDAAAKLGSSIREVRQERSRV